MAREWADVDKAATASVVAARAGGNTERGGSVEVSVGLRGGGGERSRFG